jgi:hypothetical protein
MVSKKMKRNEQHNPLSPPRKERKRKERNKDRKSNLAPLLVFKKKNKEVRGSGQPFF